MTDVDSEFVSVGINQTIHRLNLRITCNMSILTPIENVEQTIDTTIILSETVIVGEVPENYYYYDDLDKDKILDAQ